MGCFPTDFKSGQPIGIPCGPGLLDLVPKVLARARPFTAAIGMKVLNKAPVDIAGCLRWRLPLSSAERLEIFPARLCATRRWFFGFRLGCIRSGVAFFSRRWGRRWVGLAGFLIAPQSLQRSSVDGSAVLDPFDFARRAGNLHAKIAERRHLLRECRIEPAFVGREIEFLVAVQQLTQFFQSAARYTKRVPDFLLERRLIDEDQTALAMDLTRGYAPCGFAARRGGLRFS